MMIDPEPKSICQKAEPYYYDYLIGAKPEDVPDDLWRHIDCCADCQTEIALLKETMESSGENTESTEKIAAITTNLELHFAHSGRPVDCSTVKPFLPTMADMSFEVRIPTPITVHIDKCKACADDLESIRRLNLDHRQLLRLGQVLAEHNNAAKGEYERIREAVESIAIMSSENTTPDILRHKTQSMHQTVSGMIDRDESGIVTCLNIKGASQIRANDLSESKYSDWPIEVDVLDRQPEKNVAAAETMIASDRIQQFNRKQSRKDITHPHFKRFIKPFAAAAAILLVAMLAFHGANLKATDLNQVYENLAKVKNVHIKNFDPELSAISQEIWISRELNIKMFKTQDQYVLWDLEEKKKKTRDLNSATVNSIDVDNESVNRVALTLTRPMNVLPFSKTAKLPKDSTWHRVNEESLKHPVENMEVYEIVWKQQVSDGSLLDRKWRGFIESETKLPTRIEWYARNYITSEFELVTITEIDYPTTDNLTSIIHEVGF